MGGTSYDIDSSDTENRLVVWPVFPYDSLEVYTVLERNSWGQVQLEANAVGLKTRYDYTEPVHTWHYDPNCWWNNYSGVRHYNKGVPESVTIGVGRGDSLLSQYRFYPNLAVDSLIDPNQMVMDYAYDDFGRPKEAKRNGVLLSRNHYQQWYNDFNQTFAQRATSSYVEATLFNNDHQPLAEQSRAWIDPLGRAWHSASRVTNGLTGADTKTLVHSGKITYDTWTRPEKTYKPFVYDSIGVLPFVPREMANDTSAYPYRFASVDQEDNQRGRSLREAAPGLTLGDFHNRKNRYSMVTGVCMICELGVSKSRAVELLPQSFLSTVFIRVETEDEDGKIAVEYANPAGQKVATYQVIDGGTGEMAATLYFYDRQGNVTQTVNPANQASYYRYNLLGWMYEQETVDGGRTKFMFNRAGQITLEQDANGAEGEFIIPATDTLPYYRQYEYDAYGQMLTQKRVSLNGQEFAIGKPDPLAYQDQLGGIDTTNQTLQSNYYRYTFSARSTCDWLADAEEAQFIGSNYQPQSIKVVDYLAHPTLEKQWFYGDTFNIDTAQTNPNTVTGIVGASYHPSMIDRLNLDRTGMRGRLSHTISYRDDVMKGWGSSQRPMEQVFYSYNPDGELKWQLQQFNPNTITPDQKGLVVRIDYPEYNTRGSLLHEWVDVNNDDTLDIAYTYAYDGRNRLEKVYANFDTSSTDGQLLARYEYNDAYGLMTKTIYHKSCDSYSGSADSLFAQKVDSIEYTYDLRDRLTRQHSKFLDYRMYYDTDLVPLSGGGSLAGDTNFNGNINGISAEYTLLGANSLPGNFQEATKYAYRYDGMNRLTQADGWVGDMVTSNPANQFIGDATFDYDKIGNITHLKRFLPGSPNVAQEWNYVYQAGSNRLTKVAGVNTTTDRNYTYDATGNLLSDDHRDLSATNYGRANLPFTLDKTNNDRINYLYNASDSRVYKDVYQDVNVSGKIIRELTTSEFYLQDAAGQSVGILDMNTGNWTWFAFGTDRFARLKPNASQQPTFYPGDLGNTGAETGSSDYASVANKLNSLAGTEAWNFPLTLLEISIDRGPVAIYTSTELNNMLSENPELSYETKNTAWIDHPHQQLAFSDANGLDYKIAISQIVAAYQTDQQLTSAAQGGTNYTPPTWNFHSDLHLGDIVYYIHDHLGNTRITYRPTVTNCSESNFDGQTLISQSATYELENVVDYYPYGKVLREAVLTGQEKYLTTHHERDTETGFDYRGARFYDSDVARFLSLDPHAVKYPSMSDYSYVAGNPVIFVDPDGRDYELVWDHEKKTVKVKMTLYVAEGDENSYNSAANAAQFWNDQSNKFQFVTGRKENEKAYDIGFEIEVKSVEKPLGEFNNDRTPFVGLESKMTPSEASNVFQVLPDDQVPNDPGTGNERNGLTTKGALISVKESRKNTDTGTHEVGHGLGMKHSLFGIMVEYSNHPDRSTEVTNTNIKDIFKNVKNKKRARAIGHSDQKLDKESGFNKFRIRSK